MAYNQWSLNGEYLLESLSDGWSGFNLDYTSGVMSIMEIVPLAGNKDKVLLQLGAGIFFVQSNPSARISYSGDGFESEMNISPELEDSETKPGIQLGLALCPNKRIEIQPLFTLIFTKGNQTKYFTTNVGFALGK